MLALIVASLLISSSTAQFFTCECGIFVEEQFDQGGGQSEPLPLEYIGVGNENNQITPEECSLDINEFGACQEFCAGVGSEWINNNTLCSERPNNDLRCYGSVWCEDLFSQERVPDTFECEPLQVYSRIAQCPEGSEREGWVDSLYDLEGQFIGCNEDNFAPCAASPCTCDDDLTVCSPAECSIGSLF